ncbi:MAG: hypothetical protein KZQ83_16240 [gamma proteobacterium symbiont of Taylorina sp.]|nr:hypothetical protein [gamma proteobacterium symbiont of Taylorina sp.]
MKDGLFKPKVIQTFREEVVRLIKEKKADFLPAMKKLEIELQSVNKSIQKLVNFIIEAESPPASISVEIKNLSVGKRNLNLILSQ